MKVFFDGVYIKYEIDNNSPSRVIPLCSSASNHYALVFENNTILLVLNLKCSPVI